ncbi:MAG: HEAT repeat domain-containing protein [Deltaproteobacteria bacterium]
MELTSKLWRVAGLAPKEDSSATDAMENLLSYKNNSISFMEAAKALAARSGPKVETLLQGLLHSPEAVVRAETVRQLEKGNLNFAIPQWWAATEDENGWVRFVAVGMLRRHLNLWNPEEKNKFTLLMKDSDERVRATVVSKIGEWRDPAFENHLVEACSDTDARVRANALDALKLFGETVGESAKQCFELALTDSSNRARANAVVGLYPFSPEKSKQVLLEMLEDKNNLMRTSAAWAFGRLLLSDGVDILLEKLVSEKNELVASQIIMTLGLFSQFNVPFGIQLEKSLQLKKEIYPQKTEPKAA